MPNGGPRRAFRNALEFLRIVHRAQPQSRGLCPNFPDFLVIAPPKTGTTWLARQLGRHPGIFVPTTKELKYFTFYREFHDLDWYLSSFREAGERLKGEATANYALLPSATIREIHNLRPDLKLIFLMRDPVERAWSHARWSHRVREGIFYATDASIDEIQDTLWRESLLDPFLVLSGDYLGQLERWVNVFGRRQIFVGFTEQMRDSPRVLLDAVFDFLGVERPAASEDASLNERVNAGEMRTLTAELRDCLFRIYGRRSKRLLKFIRRKFGLRPPASWNVTCAAPASRSDARHAVYDDLCSRLARSADDVRLGQLLQQAERGHPHIVEAHREWNIVEFRGRLYGFPWCRGPVDFFDPAQLSGPEIVAAPTAGEIRAHIDRTAAVA